MPIDRWSQDVEPFTANRYHRVLLTSAEIDVYFIQVAIGGNAYDVTIDPLRNWFADGGVRLSRIQGGI
jgi:hypothetical protein